MTKKLNSHCLTTEIKQQELTKEQLSNAAKLITVDYEYMPYKKVTKGQYESYCPHCMNYIRTSWQELNDIIKKHHCPICNDYIRAKTTIDEIRFVDYVKVNNYGYEFVSHWKFGEPIKHINHKQMCFFDEDKIYVKGNYKLVNYGKRITTDYDWSEQYRISYSQNWSNNMFHYYGSWMYYHTNNPIDRKVILTKRFNNTIIKSNQRKLISENVFRLEIIPFIRIFDLKNKDDVFKYEKYLLRNTYHIDEFIRDNIELNVHYLDYLARNNIDLGKYYEYMKNIETLKFKLDKPTDFEDRFNKVEKMVEAEENRQININCIQRYYNLPRYKNKAITIYPFQSAREIRNCGKSLHNCIGGYVDKYADKQTDLYHLDIKGVKTIAIEVKDNILKQAYGNNNKDCPQKLFKHIKSFCETNGFSLGSYA